MQIKLVATARGPGLPIYVHSFSDLNAGVGEWMWINNAKKKKKFQLWRLKFVDIIHILTWLRINLTTVEEFCSQCYPQTVYKLAIKLVIHNENIFMIAK